MLDFFCLSWTSTYIFLSLLFPVSFYGGFFSGLSTMQLTPLSKISFVLVIANKVLVFLTCLLLSYMPVIWVLSAHFLSLFILLLLLLWALLFLLWVPPFPLKSLYFHQFLVPLRWWTECVFLECFSISRGNFFLICIFHRLFNCYVSFLLSLLKPFYWWFLSVHSSSLNDWMGKVV